MNKLTPDVDPTMTAECERKLQRLLDDLKKLQQKSGLVFDAQVFNPLVEHVQRKIENTMRVSHVKHTLFQSIKIMAILYQINFCLSCFSFERATF